MIRPKYAPGEDARPPAGRQFTDRVDYITAFRSALAAPRPPHRVLVYYGVGGIGKTTLRRELARLFAAERPGGLWCTVDFVLPPLRGPEGALAAIAYNLTHEPDGSFRRIGLNFPAFELAYLTYLQKVEPHKPIREYRNVPLFDPDSVMAQVMAATFDWASATVSVVKLINRMREMISDHLTRRQNAAIQELPGLEPREILERLPYFLAADLKNWMERHPGRPVVICLDSYEALWQRRTEGLEFETDGWVRELIAHLPEVLWVICGREKLRWDERQPEWGPALDQHLVGRMADPDMEAFLTSCGIADPAVRERIIRSSEGVPLYLDLAVDTYYEIRRTREPVPEDFTPVRGEVMDRFLHYLSEAETVTLRVLSVARWWDRPLFEHLVREFQTGYSPAAFDALTRFSFIERDAGGRYTMHELMRANLAATADPELVARIHRAIAGYCAARAGDADQPAHWMRQEEIYHLMRCDEAAGVARFQETCEHLARLGHANRLRDLVADAEACPLKSEASRLWVAYYRARLRHLEADVDGAAQAYEELRRHPAADDKLRAYAACDTAHVWVHRRLREPGARAEIESLLAEIEAMPYQDARTASVWDVRRAIHAFDLDWDGVARCTERLLALARRHGDVLGVVEALRLLKSRLFLVGNWPEYFAFVRRAEEVLAELGEEAARVHRPRLRHRGILWAGRYAEAEPFLLERLEEVRAIGHADALVGALVDVGFAQGLQRKFAQADRHFGEALLIQTARGNRAGRATALGFYGVVKALAAELDTAVDYLRERAEMDVSAGNPNGTSEALVWLGEALEMRGAPRDLTEAEEAYTLALEGPYRGRLHYDCCAMAGLMRIRFARGDAAGARAFADQAEALARTYQYNECAAAVALIRGHLDWLEGRRDEAACRYRQALIHALRFNRFALDEALGREAGPMARHGLIPFLQAQGDAGREALSRLAAWWGTGQNALPDEPAFNVSPVGAGSPLLAAERLARRLEPGDGSPQPTVLEQLAAALR